MHMYYESGVFLRNNILGREGRIYVKASEISSESTSVYNIVLYNVTDIIYSKGHNSMQINTVQTEAPMGKINCHLPIPINL